ncbi:hypothetical protein BDZ85DRAFT_49843 [Elsinoe ampelina]|uniref:Uncharacterized protein n=1 Tax=Elsinoe ampelina TaxID=302913 RepID=A0A6A6GL72_9PEZI|nr:hypothetical protein BDZ85DRAFT_49843 [Elsinoe ampelina]
MDRGSFCVLPARTNIFCALLCWLRGNGSIVMDGNHDSLPPNLADILSTLSRFAAPADQIQQQQSFHPLVDTNGHRHDQFKETTNLRPQPPSGPVIDPATITEWSTGLRCVSKIATQNPNFANAIKSMIVNQRKNEMDWYAKRQELKREQAQKGHSATELSSIMKSIGALPTQHSQQPRSDEEIKAELDTFDAKIYRAQMQMVAAMTAEMKALGVPFFGTETDLVLPDDTEHVQDNATKRITATELRTLQNRMISYLEDMYKE